MQTPFDTTVALRIIDANCNRALEGLRAVEDYLRLALNDAHLTLQCKELRHELAALASRLAAQQPHRARQTQHDVGTEVGTQGEYRRPDARAVFAANIKRVQQAIRCLEEYTKVLGAELAAPLEQLRYRSYVLEKAVLVTQDSQKIFADRTLYVLVDGRASTGQLEQLVCQLVEAGVPMLQLRDKTLTDRQLLERGRLVRQRTRGSNTLFIFNDRPDLALLAEADGVHLGQDELPVQRVRQLVGPRMLIGVSTHSIEQARQAVLDGADYIGVGPVFPSQTKSFDRLPGLALLEQVHREIQLPAFAIGGIHQENIAQVRQTGFDRVAVSQAVVGAPDPAAAARRLLALLSN